MIHALVPALGERHELGVVVDSLVSAELARIAVQHYLVTVQRRVKAIRPFFQSIPKLRKENARPVNSTKQK